MKSFIKSFVGKKEGDDESDDSQNEKENQQVAVKERRNNKQVHFLEDIDNDLSFD